MLFTVELLACPVALQLTCVFWAQMNANMLIFHILHLDAEKA
jgi:hypothetical protein